MGLFTTNFSSENHFWLKGTPQKEYYLYFELEAQSYEPTEERIPLNISLVVDRSGSMRGDKLAYVKKAVSFVIDNLKEKDNLSIVQYDDRVDVVSPSAPVRNKGALHQKVKQIYDRGATNLSGGMLEGFQQVDNTKQDNYVNRVLLLSDGLANRGITDARQLEDIARKKFNEQGIGLSTFGVGANFNEVLMTNLAEHGGANYYFINSPDEIPGIFAQELAGLLSVVAQNTKLSISFPQEYFKCKHVFGFPFELREGEVLVNFNDVVSEEKKAVLIQLENIKPFDQELSFQAKLAYEDVVDQLSSITEELNLGLQLSDNESSFTKGVNESVLNQIIYYTVNQLFEDAINKADKYDIQGAKAIITQAKSKLETHFKSYVATAELKDLHQRILEYDKRLESLGDLSRQDYLLSQKMSRSSHYVSRKKRIMLERLRNEKKE